MAKSTCSIDGCNRPYLQKGWCGSHFERWRKHGDPLAGGAYYGDPLARFWSKVDKQDCWVWTGTVKPNGYGKFSVGQKTLNAHRWSYETFVGKVPEGLDLDHLCRNRACVNPAHLEPVTRSVNITRGRSACAEKTHCPRNHPYDAANTRVYVRDGVFVGRICRACERSRKIRSVEPEQIGR